MCIDEVEFIIVGGLCGCYYCGVFGLGVGIIRGSTVADDFMIALVSNVIREVPFEGSLEFEVWAWMFDVCEYGHSLVAKHTISTITIHRLLWAMVVDVGRKTRVHVHG